LTIPAAHAKLSELKASNLDIGSKETDSYPQISGTEQIESEYRTETLGMDEQLEFMKQIATRLDSAGIPYMMTGSMAMAIYAMPRMTRDIDLVIECGPNNSDRVAELFEPDCYVDRKSIREAVSNRSMFNIIHNDWIVKADFIIRKDGQYRKLEFDRRQIIDIEGFPVSVVAAEDLILSKLHWAKEADSELQRRDARAIIESVSDLDWRYLEKWAKPLGVDDLLDQVRSR
jgi:hypothetical protein